MAGNRDAQSHDPKIKSNQNKCKQNSPRIVVSWRHSLFRASHGLMVVGGGGYKLYHSVWEPPIMYVAWKISRSHSCYVDSESIPLKIIFISVLKASSSGTSANPCFPLRRAYLLLYARVKVIFTFPFYFILWQAPHVGKILIHISNWMFVSMNYYCWHYPWGKTLGGNTISPYISLCPIKTL